MNKQDFLQVFHPFQPPQVLLELFDYNALAKGIGFHQGFKITIDHNKESLKQFSQNRRFLEALIAFAQANEQGATYALWTAAAQWSLDDAPILIFDPQEGFYPIANNSREFLQLLALQAPPTIAARQVHFHRQAHAAPPQQQGSYHRWLENSLEISPINEGSNIVAAAQNAHQKSFENWMRRHCRA